MSYLELYKKRIAKKGTTVREYRENMGDTVTNLNFELTNGYKKGVIGEVGASEKQDVDFITRNISGELQKYFLFRPKTKINVGAYISYGDNRVYIMRDIEQDTITPTARGFYCNQRLNFKGVENPIPCWASNSTYGSKGVSDVEKFLVLDAKLKVYIQCNKHTDKLKIGTRIMFANKYVFRITEMDNIVFGSGMYVLVCQRDELMPMDNLEQNIAWNEYEEHEEPNIGLEIIGDNKMTVGDTELFESNVNVTWEIDDSSVAHIIEAEEKQVMVEALSVGWFDLIATNNDKEIVGTKSIFVAN